MIDTNSLSYLIKFVNNFFRFRSFHVHLEGSNSNSISNEFGLPQGAVLSSCLYNVSAYDQPQLNDTVAALFADDTCIFAISRFYKAIAKRLQKSAQRCIKYFKKWKIGVNADKFQALFISRRIRRQTPSGPLRLSNSAINWSEYVKYLGVVFDKRLTMKKHYDHALDKAMKAVKLFYSMLCRRSRLNKRSKIKLYKAAIRSILTYASPVIVNVSPC